MVSDFDGQLDVSGIHFNVPDCFLDLVVWFDAILK